MTCGVFSRVSPEEGKRKGKGVGREKGSGKRGQPELCDFSRGKGGKRGQPELCDFPETLASAEALPGICLGVNDVSSPASLAT
jgi:hypothetical protein